MAQKELLEEIDELYPIKKMIFERNKAPTETMTRIKQTISNSFDINIYEVEKRIQEINQLQAIIEEDENIIESNDLLKELFEKYQLPQYMIDSFENSEADTKHSFSDVASLEDKGESSQSSNSENFHHSTFNNPIWTHKNLKVVIGNTSKIISPDQKFDDCTHMWMAYVTTQNNDLDRYVRCVDFYLNPTYKPYDYVRCNKPPFVITRKGWGEFLLRVILYFHDEENDRCELYHHVQLTSKLVNYQINHKDTIKVVPLVQKRINYLQLHEKNLQQPFSNNFSHHFYVFHSTRSDGARPKADVGNKNKLIFHFLNSFNVLSFHWHQLPLSLEEELLSILNCTPNNDQEARKNHLLSFRSNICETVKESVASPRPASFLPQLTFNFDKSSYDFLCFKNNKEFCNSRTAFHFQRLPFETPKPLLPFEKKIAKLNSPPKDKTFSLSPRKFNYSKETSQYHKQDVSLTFKNYAPTFQGALNYSSNSSYPQQTFGDVGKSQNSNFAKLAIFSQKEGPSESLASSNAIVTNSFVDKRKLLVKELFKEAPSLLLNSKNKEQVRSLMDQGTQKAKRLKLSDSCEFAPQTVSNLLPIKPVMISLLSKEQPPFKILTGLANRNLSTATLNNNKVQLVTASSNNHKQPSTLGINNKTLKIVRLVNINKNDFKTFSSSNFAKQTPQILIPKPTNRILNSNNYNSNFIPAVTVTAANSNMILGKNRVLTPLTNSTVAPSKKTCTFNNGEGTTTRPMAQIIKLEKKDDDVKIISPATQTLISGNPKGTTSLPSSFQPVYKNVSNSNPSPVIYINANNHIANKNGVTKASNIRPMLLSKEMLSSLMSNKSALNKAGTTRCNLNQNFINVNKGFTTNRPITLTPTIHKMKLEKNLPSNSNMPTPVLLTPKIEPIDHYNYSHTTMSTSVLLTPKIEPKNCNSNKTTPLLITPKIELIDQYNFNSNPQHQSQNYYSHNQVAVSFVPNNKDPVKVSLALPQMNTLQTNFAHVPSSKLIKYPVSQCNTIKLEPTMTNSSVMPKNASNNRINPKKTSLLKINQPKIEKTIKSSQRGSSTLEQLQKCLLLLLRPGIWDPSLNLPQLIEDVRCYKDLNIFLRKIADQFPLARSNIRKSKVHWYTASSSNEFTSWPSWKRNAAEIKRASYIKTFLRLATTPPHHFHNFRLEEWSIKKILKWSKRNGFTPLRLYSDPQILPNEVVPKKYNSCTILDKKIWNPIGGGTINNVVPCQDEEVDIETIEIQEEQKLIPSNAVFIPSICPIVSKYIQQSTNEMAVQLEPFELEDGIFCSLPEEIIHKTMQSFVKEIMRSAFTKTFDRSNEKSGIQEISVTDMYQGFMETRFADLMDNSNIGLDEAIFGKVYQL